MSCPSCKSNETRIVGVGADERSPQAFRDAPARNRLCMRCGTVYEEAAHDADSVLSLAPRVLVGGSAGAAAQAAGATLASAAPAFGGVELTLDDPFKKKVAEPVIDLPLNLEADVVVLKKCPKCGHSAMVEPSPHAACAGCGRIYAKMEQLMR
ncbi:MAG TPA: hypothetical protein VLJ86_24760 [Ramlibacter sp.]|nr:hypothetical protein [Ramlibacter sp.]